MSFFHRHRRWKHGEFHAEIPFGRQETSRDSAIRARAWFREKTTFTKNRGSSDKEIRYILSGGFNPIEKSRGENYETLKPPPSIYMDRYTYYNPKILLKPQVKLGFNNFNTHSS